MNKLKLRLQGFWAYKDLLNQLVQRDLKLKYRRSFLGYLWSVLNPLLTMIVLTIVFSQMFGSDTIPNFPVYLLTGQMAFQFLTQSTNLAMGSITGNAALLKKTYVPKYIFTLAKITSGLVDFLFTLAALLIVMVATHAPFTIQLLWIPLISLELYVFIVGLGLFLAAANVYFRDIQYIYAVLCTAWMYLTPIFYPFELLPEKLQWLIMHFNPMYLYIHQFRSVTVYGYLPDMTFMFRGWVLSMIMLFVGIEVFVKKQDDFILFI